MTSNLNRRAIESLETKGYQILGRNYMSKFGPIDLVAKINNAVVFVYVRSREDEKVGAWDDLNKWRVDQIRKAGEAWATEFSWKGRTRVDVVDVHVSKGDIGVEQWEDVTL